MICYGASDSYAGGFGQCSLNATKIELYNLIPGSREFSDKSGGRYLLGGVGFVHQKNYSATIIAQIIKKRDQLVSEFARSNEHSITNIARKPDRYGRTSVNLFANSGQRWLQQEMLLAGLAIVHPYGSGENCEKRLFLAEGQARKTRAGIWGSSIPVVMNAEDSSWQNRANSYQLVEGRVISVGDTRTRLYLNFGEKWSSDFTVVVAKKFVKRFKKAHGDLKLLTGKKVRVRGWMTDNRGPLIEVYYPGQIEVEFE